MSNIYGRDASGKAIAIDKAARNNYRLEKARNRRLSELEERVKVLENMINRINSTSVINGNNT